MGSDREGSCPRQLTMTLDSVALEGLSHEQRQRVVALLAQLLQDATRGVPGDDDESR